MKLLVSIFSSRIVGARQCQHIAVNVNFLRFKVEPEMGSNLSQRERQVVFIKTRVNTLTPFLYGLVTVAIEEASTG